MTPAHTATLAVAPNGNWSLHCTSIKLPPIALPGTLTADEAISTARNLLFCAKVTTAAQTELVTFVPNGYTVTDADPFTRRTAFTAELPATAAAARKDKDS